VSINLKLGALVPKGNIVEGVKAIFLYFLLDAKIQDRSLSTILDTNLTYGNFLE